MELERAYSSAMRNTRPDRTVHALWNLVDWTNAMPSRNRNVYNNRLPKRSICMMDGVSSTLVQSDVSTANGSVLKLRANTNAAFGYIRPNCYFVV